MNTIRITNGRIIDPSQGLDEIGELWIRGETILGIGPQPEVQANFTLDAGGKIVHGAPHTSSQIISKSISMHG